MIRLFVVLKAYQFDLLPNELFSSIAKVAVWLSADCPLLNTKVKIINRKVL